MQGSSTLQFQKAHVARRTGDFDFAVHIHSIGWVQPIITEPTIGSVFI
jgi:hypothetical protein